MSEYIAFKCGECGLINVVLQNNADGNRCMKCKGHLLIIGEAIVKKKNLYEATTTITCDSTELDKAISKVNLLDDKLNVVMKKMEKINNG